MYRFYIEPSQKQGDSIEIIGEDVNHIKNVLRMKNGEKFILCDGAGTDYLCELAGSKERNLVATVLEEKKSDTELPVRLVLYQGLPKKDKMELIIQKAVELGAAEIVPVVMKRTIVKTEGGKEEKKLVRWQAIAESAAKQSGRGVIPEVIALPSFSAALERAAKADKALMFYENEHATTLRMALESGSFETVSLLTGPEGGLEEKEVEQARNAGLQVCTLGSRILRCETAPLCVLSAVMYAAGEF